MARTQNALKNIITVWVQKLIVIILSFILRTVFIYSLGAQYVGLEGLFTNVLSLLSLSELGVGVAMTYSLYKPVAENDIEKILSIMDLYRRAYRIIAIVVMVLGIMLLPLLKYLVKEPPPDINIYLVYVGFLIDVVLSYLFTYKRSLLIAHQKTYKYTIIDAIGKVVIIAIQSIIVLMFHSYYLYLCVMIIGNFLENAFVSNYVSNVYPYLKRKEIVPLAKTEKDIIIKNVKAMFFHKFGDFAINSTDNLIISSFINVATVGIVSNYNLLIAGVNTFINNAFSSLTAGIGNFIIEKEQSKKVIMLDILNFCAFWVYGFASLCFYELLNPFIKLWIGEKYVIPMFTVGLIIFSQYLAGMRVPLSTYKTSAGVYKQDQFVPLIQAAFNLVISVIGTLIWGLPGVYIGTICSSIFVSSWNRPYTVYKYALNMSCKNYFKKYIVYLFFVFGNILVFDVLFSFVKINNPVYDFIFRLLVCCIGYNVLVLVFFNKTLEFKKIKSIVVSIVRSRRK